MSSRCEHCQFVLTASEAKLPACPVCGGALASRAKPTAAAKSKASADEPASATAGASVGSPGAANTAATDSSAVASGPAASSEGDSADIAGRAFSLPAIAWSLVIPVAFVAFLAVLLLLPIGLGGGLASVPTRILGIAVLALPLLLIARKVLAQSPAAA